MANRRRSEETVGREAASVEETEEELRSRMERLLARAEALESTIAQQNQTIQNNISDMLEDIKLLLVHVADKERSVVDWTKLPKDLLELISKSLKSSFHLCQFRSVCSSWRTSAKPKPLLPSHDFPDSVFPDSFSSSGFRLSQRIILLIKPHHEHEQAEEDSIGGGGGCLVKVEQHPHLPRKLHLIHPLTDDPDSDSTWWGHSRTSSFPRHFSCLVDMSKSKARELCREFQLHCVDALREPQKTLVKYLDDEDQSKFVLLTIHRSGRLLVFTSWDQAWTLINDDMMIPSCCFCDVILFNGCFFAVEKNGRTFAVDHSSLRLTLAAHPVFGDDNKFLIESAGEMLLVDIIGCELDSHYLRCHFEEEDVDNYFHDRNHLNNFITNDIKVFKFVEREKSWVEVEDLGDKILFLGDGFSFSASASDFLPLYGGCVFFLGLVFDWEDLKTIYDEDVGVCDFKSREIKLVRQHPEYAKLFWPPPSWILRDQMLEQVLLDITLGL